MKTSNDLIIINVPQPVRVRKYDVDIPKLQSVLRNAKKKLNISNNTISEQLDIPKTNVEHWFRTDKCFSIPSEDIWMQLKELLKIDTDYFDESILTYEERIGTYEMSERCYWCAGIAPTLTLNCANDKYIVRM